MRRAVIAVVAMLLAALVAHSALPHSAPSPTLAVERTTEGPEGTAGTEFLPVQTPGQTHNAPHEIGMPASGLQLIAPAPVQLHKSIAAAFEPPACAIHSQRAREREARSVKVSPSPIALQIFRC